MCLALPMRITAVEGDLATIAAEGLEQRCSIMLVPEAGVGDYVLVHAGYAISVIDESEAQETIGLLREMSAFADEAGAAGEGKQSSGPTDRPAEGDEERRPDAPPPEGPAG